MTALDEARLRELAEAATPGPWNDSGGSVDDFDAECMMRMEWIPNGRPHGGDEDDVNANWKNDTAFIAAANPATILALLDALSAERERADRAVGLLREAETACSWSEKALERYDNALGLAVDEAALIAWSKCGAVIRETNPFLATQSTSRTGEG